MSEAVSVDALEAANAGVRFLLEVGALLALGYWGFRTGDGIARYGLGLGLPLAVVVVWGTFGAPAAPLRLDEPARLVLESAILGGAALALYLAGRPLLAGGFALVAVGNRALLFLLG